MNIIIKAAHLPPHLLPPPPPPLLAVPLMTCWSREPLTFVRCSWVVRGVAPCWCVGCQEVLVLGVASPVSSSSLPRRHRDTHIMPLYKWPTAPPSGVSGGCGCGWSCTCGRCGYVWGYVCKNCKLTSPLLPPSSLPPLPSLFPSLFPLSSLPPLPSLLSPPSSPPSLPLPLLPLPPSLLLPLLPLLPLPLLPLLPLPLQARLQLVPRRGC